jgi:hypothetical protein
MTRLILTADLLTRDLSILPQLRRSVVEMLEELPGRATGLGASELRILELISAGYDHPFDVFPHFKQRFQRRVFGYWEAGLLLEGLALAAAPRAAPATTAMGFAYVLPILQQRHSAACA